MIEIKMPEAGFSITEGTVIEWYKKVGERVEEGENIVSVETDKLTVDIPAERTGTLHEVKCDAGDVVPVGGVMGIVLEGGESLPEIKMEAFHKEEEAQRDNSLNVTGRRERESGKYKKISPAAKAEARAKAIDLSEIKVGSGPNGRIVKQDVIEFIAKKETLKVTAQPERAPIISGRPTGKGMRVDFKGWRKVIADRMVSSKTEIPHYTMSVEADVTELNRLIQALREKEGLHITYLPFMMKAIEVGIQEVPQMNAHCDNEGFNILDQINIGIAVDLGEKLIVPVVKDVKERTILELVHVIDELVKKARKEKLEPADVDGGTITLTNVGMFQIHSATSVILQPQVSIIYMGAAREVPGVWNGNIEIRKKMIFGSTFDHRVINGAEGGRFLKKVKECLENMGTLLLRMR